MSAAPSPGRGTSDQSGQAMPLIAVLILLVTLCTIGLTHVAVATVARGRAQDAADAVALAGAGGGADAARQIARADGAVLLRYVEHDDGVVEVTVRRSGVVARARAGPVDVPDDALGGASVRFHPSRTLHACPPTLTRPPGSSPHLAAMPRCRGNRSDPSVRRVRA